MSFTQHLRSIVILTGAGISAESGLRTFRDQDGLWENHPVEDVASIEGFERNPELVQSFYNQRRAQLQDLRVQPNAAHFALAKLEKAWPGEFLIVTQNVDDLHERAGSKNIIHMHGNLNQARCLKICCKNKNRVLSWTTAIRSDIFCDQCHSTYSLRPDIVWFGEQPLEMEKILKALKKCETFVSIGTSGNVYPAAGFVQELPAGCIKIEINRESTLISSAFDEHLVGPATDQVPKWVERFNLEID